MATRIQLRRDSTANWASHNPVLAAGEVGVDPATGQLKIGDGSTAWNALPFANVRPGDLTTSLNALINAAPGALDTLGELATALQNDESLAATLTATVGGHTTAIANEIADRAAAISAAEARANAQFSAVAVVYFDASGATDTGPAIQAAFDRGAVTVILKPTGLKTGTVAMPAICYVNTPIFIDDPDYNTVYYLVGHGATLKAGTGLPTCAEFTTYLSNNSYINTDTKWMFFDNTKRTALSGGVVTCGGNRATTTRGTTGVRVELVGVGFDGSNITNGNVGLIFGNQSAARLTAIKGAHVRCLRSHTNYADGDTLEHCYLSSPPQDVSFNVLDVWMYYGITIGDGVTLKGNKVDGCGQAALDKCNGCMVTATVGGYFRAADAHGLVMFAGHSEADQKLAAGHPVYDWDSSHGTIHNAMNFTGSDADTPIFRLKESVSNKYSDVTLQDWFLRTYYRTGDGDGVGWPAIWIESMNIGSRIRVRNCGVSVTLQGTTSNIYSRTGLWISGNNTNEPTLAGALVAGRDLIASGNFDIIKRSGSIKIVPPHDNLRVTRKHDQPTWVAAQNGDTLDGSGNPILANLTGSLTPTTTYYYAMAACNTLPDGTIEYGPVSGTRSIAATSTGAVRVQGTVPSRPCTLVVWRGDVNVLTAPTAYIVLAWDGYDIKLYDTGACLNKQPWLTSSIPVPNTVAPATVNHTSYSIIMPDDSRRWFPQTKRRATAVTYNSSAVVSATDLQVTLDQYATYRMRMTVYYDGSQTGDLKVQMLLPANAVIRWDAISPMVASATGATGSVNTQSKVAGDSLALPGVAAGTVMMAELTATIRTTDTSDVVGPRFAQNVTDATLTTVFEDTIASYERVA